jgi:hypothetical protein
MKNRQSNKRKSTNRNSKRKTNKNESKKKIIKHVIRENKQGTYPRSKRNKRTSGRQEKNNERNIWLYVLCTFV